MVLGTCKEMCPDSEAKTYVAHNQFCRCILIKELNSIKLSDQKDQSTDGSSFRSRLSRLRWARKSQGQEVRARQGVQPFCRRVLRRSLPARRPQTTLSVPGHGRIRHQEVRPDSEMPDLRPEVVPWLTWDLLSSCRVLFGSGGFDLPRYEFTFDRLRAIRQDLAVQQEPEGQISGDPLHVRLLETCARFHLLSAYRLGSASGNDVQNTARTFDDVLNFSHLLESLKLALALRPPPSSLSSPETSSFVEMAAVYLILNLGSAHSLAWGLQLPPCIRWDESSLVGRSGRVESNWVL